MTQNQQSPSPDPAVQELWETVYGAPPGRTAAPLGPNTQIQTASGGSVALNPPNGSPITVTGAAGAPNPTRLLGATASGAPTSGAWNVGDIVPDRKGNLFEALGTGTAGGTAYRAAVLADSPKQWFRLADTGTTALDEMGVLNGVLHGGITTGVAGATADGDQAMASNGTTGYIDTAPNNVALPTTALTFECWVNPTAFSTTSPYLSYLMGVTQGSNNYAQLILGDATLAHNDRPRWSLSPSITGPIGINAPSGISAGAWHHLVGTWDGSNLNLYIDGVLVTGPVAATGTLSATALFSMCKDQGSGGRILNGALDEVAYYATALSAARVLAHYNAATAVAFQSFPAPYFIKDLGGIVYDASASKYGAGDVATVPGPSTFRINNAIIDANANGGGKVWVPPPPTGYILKRYLSGTYAQLGGGILLLPRVSLYGEDTKLLLRDNCAFITTRGFHNTAWPTTNITSDIAWGDQTINVADSTVVTVGQDLFLTVGQGRYDTTSPAYQFFAKAQSKPSGTQITLDRPVLQPMFVAAQAVPVLADGGAGALPAGQYTIGYTYVVAGSAGNGGWETELSPTTNITIAASHQITPTAVALPSGVTAVKWYISANTAGATNGLVATRTDATAFNINVQGNGVAAPDKSINLSGTPAGFRQVVIPDATGICQDFEISGFDLINDIANGGNAEFGLDLRFCKNAHWSRITGQDIGAGHLVGEAEQTIGSNVKIRQSLAQGGQTSKGRMLGGWNSYGSIFDNFRAEAFDGAAVFMEAQNRQVLFRKLHIVINTTNARQTPGLIAVGQESEVTIDGLLVEGFGGTYQGQAVDITDGGGTPGLLSLKDVEIRTASDIRSLHLDICSGKLILGPQSPVAGHYVEAKRWSSGKFPLTPNMAAYDVGLPAGLIKRLKVYVSTKTGITSFLFGNTITGNGADQTGALVAGGTADLTGVYGSVGTNFPVNNGGIQKKTSITTDGTVPAGAFGVIEMEYFEKILDFPSGNLWIVSTDDATKASVQPGVAASGTAVLVAGGVTVNDAKITANSVIRLYQRTPGGTPGALFVDVITAATSFHIKSTSGTDTSTVYYEVVSY